ncbi:MAG TPA: hypothetical protein VM715_19365 [Candidatus Acidoferrum sp.]|jgi:hypothetical protein|nr:hypothetical protein [Candidatus Acidoferrum sp.]
MILIIWNSGKAKECARAIEHAMQEAVQVAPSLHEGVDRLRSGEFSAVVVDQWITEAEPEATSVVFDHLGMAVPVFVNFGISGVERILRELRAALSRRGLETVLARHSARQSLRDELKDDVTVLLLSCGVVLEEPELNASVRTRLQKIEDLAKHISEKLAMTHQEHAAAAGA